MEDKKREEGPYLARSVQADIYRAGQRAIGAARAAKSKRRHGRARAEKRQR